MSKKLKNSAILVILCYNITIKLKTVKIKLFKRLPLRVADGGGHSRSSVLCKYERSVIGG